MNQLELLEQYIDEMDNNRAARFSDDAYSESGSADSRGECRQLSSDMHAYIAKRINLAIEAVTAWAIMVAVLAAFMVFIDKNSNIFKRT
jgi:hypothetical protein